MTHPHWLGRHHRGSPAAGRVPGQLEGVVAVGKGEGFASRAQFRTDGGQTPFNLRKGPLFSLPGEDGVRPAMGADGKSATAQTSRFLPGHQPNII